MTEADILVLVERIDNLKGSMEKGQNELQLQIKENQLRAELWRDKFDKRLSDLPCHAQIEVARGMKRDIGWIQKIIYTLLIITIPSIITLSGIAYSDHQTLSKNTIKWEKFDQERIHNSQAIKELRVVEHGKV